MLERPNVILRDVEAWEAEFLAFQVARRAAEAKQYPTTLLAMFSAGSSVIDDSGGALGGRGAPAAAAAAAQSDAAAADDGDASSPATPSSSRGAAAGTGAAPAAPTALGDFYERSSADEEADGGEAAQLVASPRSTPSDAIRDVQSLDRAYSQRLALLVRSASSGAWGFPGGLHRSGETMAQAAERALRGLFTDPELDVWYVGNAPIGHRLVVHDPATQAATGQYGAKHFYFRAVLMNGRFALPGVAAGSGHGLDDFAWVARDEMEALLDRPAYKYLHQIVGAGAGEEAASRAAWLQRIGQRGLTVAQATGRRAHRLSTARLASVKRSPAVATGAQAASAATPWTLPGKSAAVVAESDAYYARMAASKAAGGLEKTRLALPPAAVLAASARDARRGAAAAATAR